MAPVPTPDPLRIYVVWHPGFPHGARFARKIHEHFDTMGMARDGLRPAIPVRVRSASADGTPQGAPPPIDLGLAERNVVLFLVDAKLARGSGREWGPYLDHLEQSMEANATASAFKILIATKPFPRFPKQQSEPYHTYGKSDGASEADMDRLLIRLTHDIARAISGRKDRMTLFLSYARGDEDAGGGEPLATAIHDYLRQGDHGFTAYLDARDTPAGVQYEEQFRHTIANGSVLVIHTDRYGTRPFCRKEVLWAKQFRRPILVAQRLGVGEARSFPYQGSTQVRVVRTSTPKRPVFGWFRSAASGPGSRVEATTIRALVKDVLREVLRCDVWTASAKRRCEDLGLKEPVLLPRPIELADIAHLRLEERGPCTVVYPDPPIDAAEQRLIDAVKDKYVVRALSQVGVPA